MKGILFAAVLAATALGPSVASAMDSMTTMTPAPWVCREAKSGDTSNATMGSTGLVCRKVDMEKVHSAMDKAHAAMTKMHGGTMSAEQKAAATQLSNAMASFQTLYGFGGG